LSKFFVFPESLRHFFRELRGIVGLDIDREIFWALTPIDSRDA
jgi:hypothetical protein